MIGSYEAESFIFLLNNLQPNVGEVIGRYWPVLTRFQGLKGCLGAPNELKIDWNHTFGVIIGSYQAQTSFFLLINLQHNVGEVTGWYWQVLTRFQGL